VEVPSDLLRIVFIRTYKFLEVVLLRRRVNKVMVTQTVLG
jgi:hypothetical protein